MAGLASYRVQIRVRGTLDPAWWSARFADLAVVPEPEETTRLVGVMPDQAALHGLLAAIRDLGLSLVSVDTTAAAPAPGDRPTEHPRGDAR